MLLFNIGSSNSSNTVSRTGATNHKGGSKASENVKVFGVKVIVY
jgi:hypothetical protein